jgi:hypothetical protein
MAAAAVLVLAVMAAVAAVATMDMSHYNRPK